MESKPAIEISSEIDFRPAIYINADTMTTEQQPLLRPPVMARLSSSAYTSCNAFWTSSHRRPLCPYKADRHGRMLSSKSGESSPRSSLHCSMPQEDAIPCQAATDASARYRA